ncbi:MAG: hypothetical protein KDA58_12580 [Planctomycetaceae bacterium]|nr:hypothetical protein [Planctomycetaceae bacterium]
MWRAVFAFYLIVLSSTAAGFVPRWAPVASLLSLPLTGFIVHWMMIDSRHRRHPIPFLSQDWCQLFPYLSLPAYLIWSRGWRGVGWLLLHLVVFVGFCTAISAICMLRGWSIPAAQ